MMEAPTVGLSGRLRGFKFQTPGYSVPRHHYFVVHGSCLSYRIRLTGMDSSRAFINVPQAVLLAYSV